MAIVVSDTSPIRALDHLGLLSVLQSLYAQVFIPEAVVRELLRANVFCPAIDPAKFPFLIVESPQDQVRVAQLKVDLDEGESQAIVLALEKTANFLLIDEKKGRAIAEGLGLSPVGVLSVLVSAKEQGLIPEVRGPIQRLKTELNFHISKPLFEAIMRRAKE